MTIESINNIVAATKFLKHSCASENFVIHFDICSARDSRGMGRDGVRHDGLIDCYLKFLELGRSKLLRFPFNRGLPSVEKDGKIHVFVLDTRRIVDGAFTINAGNSIPIRIDSDPSQSVYGIEAPVIFLPSRFSDMSVDAIFDTASVYAVHEVVHIFGFKSLSQSQYIRYQEWEWFDEAYATWFETQALPEKQNYLPLMMSWADAPSLSLMDGLGYRHMPLIDYIFKFCEAEIRDALVLSKVWSTIQGDERPVDTLSRHIGEQDRHFVSADYKVEDIFANGYCVDSYFLWDEDTLSHNLGIYERYGVRAITQSWELTKEPVSSPLDELGALACHYYRFFLPKEKIDSFQVNIDIQGETDPLELKAILVEAKADTRAKDKMFPLKPNADKTSLQVNLSQSKNSIDPTKVDHYVLVVVNCDMSPVSEFDDDIPIISYTVEASIT